MDQQNLEMYQQDQNALEGQEYPEGGIPPKEYGQQTEEIYQQQIENYSRNVADGQLQNMNVDDSHICPIHGIKGRGKQGKYGRGFGREENNYEYIHEQVNNVQDQDENGEDADNYKFYESKRVTRKVENMNSMNENIERNLNTLNVQNIVGQENMMGTGIGMTQEVLGTQDAFGAQESSLTQEVVIPKLYIATKVTPVYSEVVEEQFQSFNSNHVCNVCGNPYAQGQIVDTQRVVYNTRPIVEQTMVEQQYSEY